MTPELARARRAAVVVGLVLPAIIIVAVTAVQLVWLPRMPTPAAVHWGPTGLPDGFGSPWQSILMSGGSNALLLILSVVQQVQFARANTGSTSTSWSSAARLLPAFVLGLTVSLQTFALGNAWVQLDAADARETGSTLGVLIGGFAAGLVVGAIAFLVQPKLRLDPEAGKPQATPLPLAREERAAWVGEVSPSRGVLWAIGIAVGGVAALTVWMFTIEPIGGWISLGTLVFIAAVMPTALWFRVRIGPRGFEARSIIGWPVFHVPAAEITEVVTAHIEPLGEFGGWGLRFAGGRTGIVPRSGEGIVITRENGKVLVVTLDGADEAAAVLSAAAAAARNPGPTASGGNVTSIEGDTP
ncbi:DUF1648 domain-containing protein [Leucobacter albus]|uniref:DUF1648 domain-containing protein n=1 Tax=Leucobacter albus TaxID=272210 RepID=A0ABW3TNV8_9MICO